MLDDVTVFIESYGGDAALGQLRPVIRSRQFLLNGRGNLGVEHRALFDTELAQFQIAGQRGLDPPPGHRLLGRLPLMSEMEASSAVAASAGESADVRHAVELVGPDPREYIGTIALVERYHSGVEH